jgi:competence protein ComEC
MKVMGKFSRYQRLVIASSIIIVFLLITGFSASIVRAAIVCGLSLLAWYYGRSFRPAVLLGVTAVVTALYKPEYIWGDAGWYLSFLAFTGILIVSPILKHRIYRDREPKLIGKLCVETASVLLLVTPYSLFLFGTFSAIALPANILIVPLVPLAMATSALCIIIPSWLSILAIPANLVLSMILELSRLLSTVPYASSKQDISFYEMAVMYAVLAIVLLVMWNKRRVRLTTNVLIQ